MLISAYTTSQLYLQVHIFRLPSSERKEAVYEHINSIMNRGIEYNPKHCEELKLFGSEEKYVLLIPCFGRLKDISD